MEFELIPAIDLHSGKLARLHGDRSESLELREGDPVEVAREWVSAGARWIHVVDLDAAIGGSPSPANLEILSRVAALGCAVQAGGGLSEDGVRSALSSGASRAVLGAASLLESDAVERSVAEHGLRLAVGLDVRNGVVAPRGSGRFGPPVGEALARLAAASPHLIVYTDAERDGSLSGPNLYGLGEVASATGVPVLASGGVRSPEDLMAVAAVPGVVGAVVGRAIQEGDIDLTSAIRALARAG